MAQKNNDSTKTETPATHSEPMTAEMKAAVNSNIGGDEKPAKKSAPKKKAATKKKVAPKKKSSVKKKAAIKKKSAVKKRVAPKKKASPKKKTTAIKKNSVKKSSSTKKSTSAASVIVTPAVTDVIDKPTEATPTKVAAENASSQKSDDSAIQTAKTKGEPSTKVVLPTHEQEKAAKGDTKDPQPEVDKSEKIATAPTSVEELEHQQQIRQKLVDLGVADATEIGAISHKKDDEHSDRPFWIRVTVALIIIVGLYTYAKSNRETSTTQIDLNTAVTETTSLDSSSHDEGEEAYVATPATADSEESTPESDYVEAADITSSATINEEQPAVEARPKIEVNRDISNEVTANNREDGILPVTAENSEPTVGDQPVTKTAETTVQEQNQIIPGYIYPNPWNPNYYPPFNMMNQVAPVNPYYYPPINMTPGFVPPPYYNYPVAPYHPPYQTPLPAPAE
ncbi:MAG: hypothetical protein GQ470_02855 [Gammaproteobacteria bacterium]|nr:hypothetical protein [Gammaproteobacteria bacterium]